MRLPEQTRKIEVPGFQVPEFQGSVITLELWNTETLEPF